METVPEEIVKQNQDKNTSTIAYNTANLPLHKQLIYALIPAIGIPLVLAGWVGYCLIQKNTETEINNQLFRETVLAQDIFNISLDRASAIPLSLASNPAVIDAVKTGNNLVTEENLNSVSISNLEERFEETKLLQPNFELNNYLQTVAQNNNFSEIFITEKSGFNIAYSQPTSDFVQRDESWWQNAITNSQYISDPSLDDSSNSYSISLVQTIQEPQSGKFLGVIKAVLPVSYLQKIGTNYLKNANFLDSQKIQIIDTKAKSAIATITKEESSTSNTIIGGDAIAKVSNILSTTIDKSQVTPEEIRNQLLSDISLDRLTIKSLVSSNSESSQSPNYAVSFIYQNKQYTLTKIPNASFVISASVDRSEITTAANRLLPGFLLLILALFLITTAIILVLSRKISNPLKDLTIKVQEAALGDLNIKANLTGTVETITLAHSFNNLIAQVEQTSQKQARILRHAEATRQEAEAIAEEQQAKTARIQHELLELLGDVEGASSGDLTVRSRINDGEIGIVADFFNSIIESLREIIAQVKQATEQVNASVGENKKHISELATGASEQANQITQTLVSVEQITRSIQQVADNAQEAAKVAHIASNRAKLGGQSMELTVNSIQQLRETIDQTADKVKSLGEASQDISRVISLINQIAMQTNLLSINASIEAARAGEEGKGFAVVAEEVGELAAQSSEATKEVGTIIAKIQKEISQVVGAMEIGIIQAEEGTNLVKGTKESLVQIMEVSYQIDSLVQSISTTTVSQAETSQNVTQLMEQIAQLSEQTSDFSQTASNSLESTVEIAKKLQSSVGSFTVERED